MCPRCMRIECRGKAHVVSTMPTRHPISCQYTSVLFWDLENSETTSKQQEKGQHLSVTHLFLPWAHALLLPIALHHLHMCHVTFCYTTVVFVEVDG